MLYRNVPRMAKKRRPLIYSTGPACSGCGKKPESPRKRTCNACSAAYMREYRKTHKLTGDALAHARARTTLNAAIRRHKMMKQPCEVCGGLNVEAHHDDYSKPLDVRWLCRGKHLEQRGYVKRVEVLHRPAIQPTPGDCFPPDESRPE